MGGPIAVAIIFHSIGNIPTINYANFKFTLRFA